MLSDKQILKKFKNVMIDLETLGTMPGSIILSIGAVPFDSTGVSYNTFYTEINTPSSRQFLISQKSTLEWWEKQTAQNHLLQRCDIGGTSARTAFSSLLSFLGENCTDDLKVWGNGASFDEPILATALERFGIQVPWKYYNSRCYRTLKALGAEKGVQEPKNMYQHNALSDAAHQADHAVRIAQALGLVF